MRWYIRWPWVRRKRLDEAGWRLLDAGRRIQFLETSLDARERQLAEERAKYPRIRFARRPEDERFRVTVEVTDHEMQATIFEHREAELAAWMKRSLMDQLLDRQWM